VVQACKKVHNDEIRKERLAALKSNKVGKQAAGQAARFPRLLVTKNAASWVVMGCTAYTSCNVPAVHALTGVQH